MKKKKSDGVPITVLFAVLVYVVIYTGHVTYYHIALQLQEHRYNKLLEAIELKLNLKPGSFKTKEFNQMTQEERRKYLKQHKLKIKHSSKTNSYQGA